MNYEGQKLTCTNKILMIGSLGIKKEEIKEKIDLLEYDISELEK